MSTKFVIGKNHDMASHKSRVMIVHSNETYAYESTTVLIWTCGYLNEYEHEGYFKKSSWQLASCNQGR